MKRETRQKRVSARVSEDTDNTIKANGLSYGDALEIVANMLKNEKSLLEYEYNKLKSENKTYENTICKLFIIYIFNIIKIILIFYMKKGKS